MPSRTIQVQGILSTVRKGNEPEVVIASVDDHVISTGRCKHRTRRHVLAWCVLAGWLLSAGGVLLAHMQQNPVGICVTRS
jgi:hypothetical protein